MAKRANPYIEDFVPQSKTHIGLKQFNNNEDRLKKVYEKTLQILFRGAKKCTIQETETLDCMNIATGKRDKMKQLFIAKDGTLLHSGKMIDKQSSLKNCACSSDADSQCGYCEVALCGRCQHPCALCTQLYCSSCTITKSEGSNVCVSCYH